MLVILSPVAGRGSPERRRRIRDYLTRDGVGFELRETTSGSDAFRWAREADAFDLVSAAGGDGTAMEVIDAEEGFVSKDAATYFKPPLDRMKLRAVGREVKRDAVLRDSYVRLDMGRCGVTQRQAKLITISFGKLG